jgi:hypothetical protein
MHNAARGTLAIGAIFLVIGIVVTVFGLGSVAGAVDLEENAEMIGTSGSFTSNDDAWGFEFFVKGEISESECMDISVTVEDSTGSEEGEVWGSYYDEDCYSNNYEYEGYTYIGFFSILHENGVYSVDASREVIVVDTSDGVGEAIGGGILATFCGFPSIVCGLILALIGGVLGVTLKDKQDVQITTAPQQQPPQQPPV